MAYKIQYSPESVRRYPQVRKSAPVKMGRWIGLLLVIAAVLWMRLNGVPDFLIPGDPEVTKAAAAMMVDEMHAGTPMREAVTVFCKEILHGTGF